MRSKNTLIAAALCLALVTSAASCKKFPNLQIDWWVGDTNRRALVRCVLEDATGEHCVQWDLVNVEDPRFDSMFCTNPDGLREIDRLRQECAKSLPSGSIGSSF